MTEAEEAKEDHDAPFREQDESSVMQRVSALDKETLIAVCRRLGKDIGFTVLARALPDIEEKRLKPKTKSKRKRREFEMKRWAQRDVALWISYEGDKYSGFADQRGEINIDTVERRLFEALEKCRLIQTRDACRYTRCGRTDRGVSALRQVVGLRIRSALTAEEVLTAGLGAENETGVVLIEHDSTVHPGSVLLGEDKAQAKKELSYCEMLNRVLPSDIRALAWAPVPSGFSARFSAASRTYRYFFLPVQAKTGHPYNMEAMRDAAQRLVGEHDFRHFCKMDVEHVKNFTRIIYSIEIKQCVLLPSVSFIEIRGQAFLWHMVRCLVVILFAVAEGYEQPSIIDSMLDIDTTPRRPQYCPADELPLVLHDCQFDTIQPLGTPETLCRLDEHLEDRAREALVLTAKRLDALNSMRSNIFVQADHLRAHLLRDQYEFTPDMHENEEATSESAYLWNDALTHVRISTRSKLEAQYVPLLRRQGGMTYDERLQSMGSRKRERLDANERKRQAAEGADLKFHATMRAFG